MFKITTITSAVIGLLLASLFGSSVVVVVRAQDINVGGTTQDEGSILVENLVDRCVIDYDPDVDYFPVKYQKPSISSYGDIDIFGEKFEPHNTTDFLEITYFKTYKIVTNKHQDPPVSYLLYQCGTEKPQDVIDDPDNKFDLVLPIPHQGGLALTQTPQIPYPEMLGLRGEIIGLIGNPSYVTSPCLSSLLDDGSVEVVYDSNSTIQRELIDDYIERNPNVIIFSGPTNNVVGDRVMVVSATQERTNVATFDWMAFWAALYNLEGEASRITSEMQASYDCSSDNAKAVAAQQRELVPEEKQPVILWANYFTYQNLGWSVAECPTWDSAYYCEYAAHCDATILSRPEGAGYNKTYGGSPTVYWYLIHSGQGPSAWNEQRYAEYDVVGLDMCDIVGRSSTTGVQHERRWFRNVFTEPIGSLETCNVPDEIFQPYVPPGTECDSAGEEDTTSESSSAPEKSSLLAFYLAMVAFVLVV
ncbi:hypothetical protein FRACYDRAFT_246327 [Fragilariopsis cylindrus CCMP1102]|uniref:Uncharacterized protein n=1 Tax=Fragilariopsis cylindrus CCMP1102 TaxID=635003 RepID=A0A1E7EZF5_9STRA|nr:hypothetical protein FRACYDRAFT_246327 [Fragilariopsis cylindrus CCMP1102]|eukprot:OEU11214.1 hypothetical protein FRACYDRAFT_246327 [Fragilariopsis cylindrus CCMP1102]